jgi:hypothetical protein
MTRFNPITQKANNKKKKINYIILFRIMRQINNTVLLDFG